MRKSCVVVAALAFTIAVTGPSTDLQAWGNDGHKIVCAIAYKLLSQADRTEVDRLTHLFRAPDNGQYQFFTTACTFPDRARSQSRSKDPATAQLWKHFAQFSNWHFLNLARTEKTVAAEDCHDDCVLHGIDVHSTQLGDHSLQDPDRAEALLFLGHWVGDVHQPLHISYEDDLGGNDIKPITGFYTNDNLHAVWDSGIISHMIGTSDWWTFAGTLRNDVTPQLQQQWSAVPRKDWAQESYGVTIRVKTVYCKQSGGQCAPIPGGRTLTATYQSTFDDVVKLRLKKAGARLATLIHQAIKP